MVLPIVSVRDPFIALAFNMEINIFNTQSGDKSLIKCVPDGDKVLPGDYISDLSFSIDGGYVGAICATSKVLHVFNVVTNKSLHKFTLLRAASKLRFTPDSKSILVADKTGDVYVFGIGSENKVPEKILGHLSLLIDILITDDKKYVITCDRDEKIKVSNYPNCHDIQSYCLGHKEFVKCIEFLPHDNNCLVSASGDGTVRIWHYISGKEVHIINTNEIVQQDTGKLQSFIDKMDKEEVEVAALPISHMSVTRLDDKSSRIVVSILNYNILVYMISSHTGSFQSKLQYNIDIGDDICNFMLQSNILWLCIKNNNNITLDMINFTDKEQNFSRVTYKVIELKPSEMSTVFEESFKVLYKRKFDNVQEYQERKKKRLLGEKTK